MMTRKTSQKVAILKQIALIPLIAAIGFLFSTRVIAQDNTKQQPVKHNSMGTSYTDAPQSVVNEYYALLKKHGIDTLDIQKPYPLDSKKNKEKVKEWYRLTHLDTLSKMDAAVRNRLGQLYSQMSEKQIARENGKLFLRFVPKSHLRTKIIPTKEQYESWKNPRMYGIWINQRRAKNTVLNSHSNTDYAYVVLRNLNKDEAKLMKYEVEVALTPKEDFEKGQQRTTAILKEDASKYQIVMESHGTNK